MQIHFLCDKWSWLGQHTGYDQLIKPLQQQHQVTVSHTQYKLSHRILGKIYSVWKRWERRNPYEAASEIFFPTKLLPKIIYHVLYFDSHYFMWERWQKSPNNLITTIHHPLPRPVPKRMLKLLPRVSSAIVLSSRDASFWQSQIGAGRVMFIPHGVDTQFFVPGNPLTNRRLLFVGRNGRNNQMLTRVAIRLLQLYPELRFDFLVPMQKDKLIVFEKLLNHPAITWHQNISDQQLRALYQNAYLLLMPLQECTANNAVVEALACATPIVTTNVGAICDYGGDTVYPVVANDDDDAMIRLIEQYLQDANMRQRVGQNARSFAESQLAWEIIAEKHLQIYNTTLFS